MICRRVFCGKRSQSRIQNREKFLPLVLVGGDCSRKRGKKKKTQDSSDVVWEANVRTEETNGSERVAEHRCTSKSSEDVQCERLSAGETLCVWKTKLARAAPSHTKPESEGFFLGQRGGGGGGGKKGGGETAVWEP